MYQQLNRVAIGGPLVPVLANWFLGVIETKLFLNVSDFYTDFYVRYVDDCFAVLFSPTALPIC